MATKVMARSETLNRGASDERDAIVRKIRRLKSNPPARLCMNSPESAGFNLAMRELLDWILGDRGPVHKQKGRVSRVIAKKGGLRK